MGNEPPEPTGPSRARERRLPARPPQPTAAFRRRSWLAFQRALDPLAQPKPLRIERH